MGREEVGVSEGQCLSVAPARLRPHLLSSQELSRLGICRLELTLTEFESSKLWHGMHLPLVSRGTHQARTFGVAPSSISTRREAYTQGST